MKLQPILLNDYDGLRLINKGHIGPYPVVSQHNPELIAEAINLRRKRNIIRETNYRQWG